MDDTLYPKYWAWCQLLNQRDNGLILVALVAVSVLAWLIICRFGSGRMDTIRRVLVVGFFGSAALLLVMRAVIP